MQLACYNILIMKRQFSDTRRAVLFTGICYGLTLALTLPFILSGHVFDLSNRSDYATVMILSLSFMWFPTIAALITRRISRDTIHIRLAPRITHY